MRTLAERLKAMTPINWSLLNFIQLQAMHLMMILITFVMFYYARDQWIITPEQMQAVLRVWLWITWAVFAYTAIGIIIWAWNACYAVRDWWRSK